MKLTEISNRMLKNPPVEEGMEPADLLCSRNARPEKALVGRAQWKINQSTSLERNEQAWTEHVYRSMGASRIDQATLENEMGIWEEIRRGRSIRPMPHP
jgi:hypothetical protein